MRSTYKSMLVPLKLLLYLERVPGLVVLGILVGLALLVYAVWPAEYGEAAAATFQLLVTLGDWLALALLPRLERSFGPVNPPLISLAVVRAAMMLVLAVIAPHHLNFAVAVGMAITGVSLYALWIEPFRLGVTRQILNTPKLKALGPGTRPVRLLHIGDLHVERISLRERELNRLVNELAPDLILFTGDFISLLHPNPDQAREDIRRVIGEWRAPLGVYVIQGSPLIETEGMVASYVEGLETIHWLRDEVVRVETDAGLIDILGMNTTHDRETDIPRLRELTQTLPDDESLSFHLLLYHTPDLAPEADELGYDLYLAGHTHGGQIRLPLVGPIITSSEFWRSYAMGRYDLEHVTLYVTRGVGVEGASAPRIRVLCPPEIVLWEIRGES